MCSILFLKIDIVGINLSKKKKKNSLILIRKTKLLLLFEVFRHTAIQVVLFVQDKAKAQSFELPR